MRIWPKRKLKSEVPKVWITLDGFPFYVPVTAPEVELHYGINGAKALRKKLLSSTTSAPNQDSAPASEPDIPIRHRPQDDLTDEERRQVERELERAISNQESKP